MKELSLNVLDIIENSINAKAKNIHIVVNEDDSVDLLEIIIKDDGVGMDDEFLKTVCDPFTTSSTNKKVGLGLPLLKQEAELTSGGLRIKSKKGIGTEVQVSFKKSCVDTPPLGDLVSTIICVFATHPEVNLYYKHTVNGKTFEISTDLIRKECGDNYCNPVILKGIKEFFQNSIESLYGGE
ncbi:MAG: ATP-binding protein [Caldisericaceae bacterium]